LMLSSALLAAHSVRAIYYFVIMVSTSFPFIADRRDQASAYISMGMESQRSYARTEAHLLNGFCQLP
jgi:hypothetical protein